MTHDQPWVKDALCAQVDADLWHPEDRGQTREALQAKQICKQCPVITPCGEWALAHPEEWGIWGGMSMNERRQRRRAAGVKHPSGWTARNQRQAG